MKSFYDLTKDFEALGDNQEVYKNIYDTNYFSLFTPRSTPMSYVITEVDIDRIDTLMFRYYGSAEWDDLILFINQKSSVYELNVGDVLLLPSINDLTSFYNSRLA